MSSNYNSYGGYGGNPYEQGQAQTQQPYGAATSNPYSSTGNTATTGYGSSTQGAGTGYGSSNPYGSTSYNTNTSNYGQAGLAAPGIQHQDSSYSQQSQYSQQPGFDGSADPTRTAGQTQYVAPVKQVLSERDFLSQVENIEKMIRELTSSVDSIASLHQQSLSSPDARTSGQLEALITETQVKNTQIRDQIRKLEIDAASTSPNSNVKNTQIKQLKTSFQNQLQQYRQEEAKYEQRYREQIARQYRIVNPEATDAEVQEASQADWGNEGVFQTALKSNRTATANTVLGSVRARHNDIQKIERTMNELVQLMEDLATTVVLQEGAVTSIEKDTENVHRDTEAGNVQLDKGIKHAKNARRLKWWLFWIIVAIVIILGLVLGLYFGLPHAGAHAGQWDPSVDMTGPDDVEEYCGQIVPEDSRATIPCNETIVFDA